MDIDVIIEIPKGSNIKYEYSSEKNNIFVNRIFPDKLVFPYNYGRIDKTLMPDGDELDVILINDRPIFPTASIKVRIIGVLLFEDGENYEKRVIDNNIIAVPAESVDSRYNNIRDIDNLSEKDKKKLIDFFSNYKKKEGKYGKVNGFANKEKAYLLLNKAKKLYKVSMNYKKLL